MGGSFSFDAKGRSQVQSSRDASLKINHKKKIIIAYNLEGYADGKEQTTNINYFY